MEKVITAPVDGGNWVWVSDPLPRYDTNGQEIDYRIFEVTIPEYDDAVTMTGDGPNYEVKIVNTYTGYAELQVTKEWEDYNDRYGIRPASVTVELLKNGQPTGITQDMDETNGWHVEFKGLQMKESGRTVAYSVSEMSVDPYVPIGIQSDPYDVLIRNVYEVTPANLRITKNWEDGNNIFEKRPDQLTFLNALTFSYQAEDGTTGAYDLGPFYLEKTEENTSAYSASGDSFVSIEVTENDNVWIVSVNNLPVKMTVREEPVDVVWTVSENALENYRLKESSGNAQSGFVFTNEVNLIRFSGEKTWDHGDQPQADWPDSATILILSSKQDVYVYEAASANDWKWKSDLLPKYDSNGDAIAYSVQEEPIHGYKYAVGAIDDSKYPERTVTIKNTFTGLDEIEVIKLWQDSDDRDGIRPNSIEVELYQRGVSDPIDKITITDSNEWQGKFTNLPRQDSTGQDLEYYIKEVNVPGYDTAVIINLNDLTYEVQNPHTFAARDIKITKTWDDDDDVLNLRPEHEEFLSALIVRYQLEGENPITYDLGSFTLDREENGTSYYSAANDRYVSVEVTENGNVWNVMIKGLPKLMRDPDGFTMKEAVWMIEEDESMLSDYHCHTVVI